MTIRDPIEDALRLPSGARFYRCSLQVNPFEYVRRHNKPTTFADESSYNAAIVKACKAQGIEVIAVTDHYEIKTSQGLIEAAREAGIHVFPGFEPETKEGVHFLCLFDPSTPWDVVDRRIGECGVSENNHNASGKYDATELMEECRKWGAVCIAAHVASDKGILRALSGQARVRVWTDPNLLAVSLPGPITDVPDDIRPILQNKNADYRRDRPVAVLNAQDVCSPEDIQKPGTSCWIKMSEVSAEGLRQAFLDPGSRIRLASDPEPEEHAEFVAIAWQGGFLDNVAIHFNENINVLIGGRGTGKSTVIESLRYVLQLEPLGDDAKKAHHGIMRDVLRSGTKVSLLVRSHHPAKREYLIERTVPNPPTVRDRTGDVLTVTPRDILPRVEVYGQHEIAEIAKSPEKLTRLLDRFVDQDQTLARRKTDLHRELERSRSRLLDVRKELNQIEERLAALPAIEETLRRYQEAGLEDRLKEQSMLVREERLLKTAEERLLPFKEILEQLGRSLPLDRAFISETAIKDLPGKEILRGIDTILQTFEAEIREATKVLDHAVRHADGGMAATRSQWEVRKREVLAAYEKILRELQKTKVDGEEFLRLRRQIEDLRPLKEREAILLRIENEHEQHRKALLAEWEEVKAEEFRRLERAAKKVSRQLPEHVRVRVDHAGNREPLFTLLRDEVGGRLKEAIDELRKQPTLSLTELVNGCRAGREAVTQKYAIPLVQADRLAQAPSEVLMRIEELELPSTTRIELNVAAEGLPADWKELDRLSTGQKATAVLLLLLLESDAPLVVDQPEDDLDNRFVTEGVVPKMREEKRRRQFIFATHNANIPVLGDAELIMGLLAAGEAGQEGHAEISSSHMGSIDARPVREMVEEILEGGKDAFEMRRLKYGF